MDQQTRNQFEHYCALAEIEENPEKFEEIAGNITRLLKEKQVLLNRQRPTGKVHYPTAPSNVA
jgi:DNA-binding ferritin-like protein